jgi:hypothetical protein
MPYKVNKARRQKFPKARYRVKNWGEYDQALQNRGSLTVWVTPEAIAAWQAPPTGQRGGPLSIRIWRLRPGTCCAWPLVDRGGKPKAYCVPW